MATKSFDSALDFLPEQKARGEVGFFGLVRAVLEAFEEGRVAEAKYRDLVAHGVSHEDAARKVFEGPLKH